MFPDEVPVFTVAHIIQYPPGEPGEDYRAGDQVTTVGWLKELFLYGPPESVYFNITEADRKDYEGAIALFRKVNGIGAKVDLDDWEENPSNTPVQQAEALNKCMRELGYKY